MKLKNYTSETPVEKSIGEITRLLVNAGASQIGLDYEEKRLVGIIFRLKVNLVDMLFRLPAKPEAVAKVMHSEVKKPRRGTHERIDAQAERTAWALLRDWVHVQVSMIAMEQAEAVQVFLPYAWDVEREQTFFDRMRDGGFKLLGEARHDR